MIGILGASGAIGGRCLTVLKECRPGLLVKAGIHSRIPKAATDCPTETVEIDDGDQLGRFFRDCKLVINAAGPAHRFSPAVLKVAVETGTALVDLGECAAYEELAGGPVQGAGGTVQETGGPVQKAGGPEILFACGAVPGVAGLIPPALVRELSKAAGRPLKADVVRSYYSINDVLSYSAAADFLSVFSTAPRASTTLTSRMAGGEDDQIAGETVDLPLFGNQTRRYRYADAESRAVDALTGCAESEWYMVREGDELERFLRQPFVAENERAAALARFSQVRMGSTDRYIRFLVTVEAVAHSDRALRTCFAQSTDPVGLSARTAVAAALAILDAPAGSGVRRMCCSRHAPKILDQLLGMGAFDVYTVYPGPPEEMLETDEL